MCHTDAGKHGLSLDALTGDPNTVAEHDRRQPTQPPRRVFGNPQQLDPAGSRPGQPRAGHASAAGGATGLPMLGDGEDHILDVS